jgi:hypothetical protein
MMRAYCSQSENQPGRTYDDPLLQGPDFVPGIYEITFHLGDYFAEPSRFLDVVPVRFTIADVNMHLSRAAALLAVELFDLPRELNTVTASHRIAQRLEQLAQCTDDPPRLTRLAYSPR